jgi:hypothetical protein
LGIVRKDKLVALCLFRLLRADLETLDWGRSPLDVFEEIEAALCELSTNDDRLMPIDLDDEEEVREVVRAVAESLKCRA